MAMGYVDLNENKKLDWVTPLAVRDLLVEHLGPLELDTCTTWRNPMGAKKFFTPNTDGLAQPWRCDGWAWSNFPWSTKTTPLWIDKAAREGALGAEVITLSPSRSDTRWFRQLWSTANAVCFWNGRMTFLDPVTMEPIRIYSEKTKKWSKGPCPVPTMLGYWGPRAELFEAACEGHGVTTVLR